MEKIAIVGAGLVGSLEAILLAKRGYEVHVFERRPDLRNVELVGGRSINLALSNRGWKALALAGVKEKIEQIAIPMYGRMMHSVEGELTEQPYGKEGEAIYSVSRGELNKQLLLAATEFENVHFHFHHRCVEVELDSQTLHFFNEQQKKEVTHSFDFIIGSDGAFSAIRTAMMKTDRFNYSQFYLEHGYKELTIPPTKDGGHKISKNHLHIWPRGHYMLIALANLDGSFTVTLFFPFEGEPSFSSLTTETEVKSFFEEVFPDALALMPTLLEDYFANPTSSLVTVRCAPWNFGDRILLIGDSSHAIVPFYGQGMNSGFEDCYVLEEFLNKHEGNLAAAIPTFAKHRKPDGDAISELALRNFIEMRDLVGDEDFLLRKKIEKKLYDHHPDKWVPLYSMVTFNDEFRYSEALAIGEKQDAIMEKVMRKFSIHQEWDSEEVENEILRLLEADES